MGWQGVSPPAPSGGSLCPVSVRRFLVGGLPLTRDAGLGRVEHRSFLIIAKTFRVPVAVEVLLVDLGGE